ncbi:MAG: hypothetical protein STSR0008_15500 [Ignavibacterium sp.]
MIKNYINLLSEQSKNLKVLNDNLLQIQTVVIDYQIPKLDLLLPVFESSLKKISELEEQRLKLLNKIREKYSIDNNESKASLSILLENYLSNNELQELRSKEVQLKLIIKNIQELNFKNLFLINHSRHFLKDLVSTLLSNQKSILDRKV